MSRRFIPDSDLIIRAPLLTRRRLVRGLFPYALFVFVPISVAIDLLRFHPIAILITTILAIVPVTTLIARSTQDLSRRTATIVGSLFNATFGNAIELLIAIFAIRAGLVEMVKASIIGSIVINILLLIGLSMVFGGFKYREQRFSKGSVGIASTMLLIAVAGLSLPTIYSLLTDKPVIIMSKAVSITLAVTYILSLVFVLITHRHLFEAKRDVSDESGWGLKLATLVLLVSIGIAGVESAILVSVLKPIVETTGLSEVFIGLVLIAIITNVPEHIAAIRFGMRNNITLSMEIGMNSAIQIALFVAPVLVFISPLFGGGLTLAFAPFQMIALILAVTIINYIGSDGICNWLEGVQLVSVYVITAIAFYFI